MSNNNTFSQSRIRFSMHGLFVILAGLLFLRHVMLVLFGVSDIATLLFGATYAVAIGICLLSLLLEPVKPMSVIAVLTVLVLYLLLLKNDNVESVQGTLSMVFSLLLLLLFRSDNTIYRAEKVYRAFVIATSAVLCLGMFMGGNTRGGILLYYTDNGNQSALLLLCYFLNLYLMLSSFSHRGMKLLCIGLMLLLAYGCYRTESRTALIIVILVVVLSLVAKFSIKTVKVITYGILIFAFLAPFFITTLMALFGEDLELFGQTIYTGREILWRNATSKILKGLLETHFGEIVPTTGMSYYGEGLNAHNAFLEIAWRYSMFVAVPFFVIMLQSVHAVVKTASERLLKIILPFFCGVFIHMAFESSLFVGAVDFSLLILLPLIILLNKERMIKREA